MHLHLAVHTGIDPKITERFLLAQPSVVDADVWYVRGRLHAKVAVVDQEPADVDLREECARALGPNQAPANITLVSVRLRAA